MKFSLVIPCYNESANLPLLFERCKKLVDAAEGKVEVVIVNNGSSDDSDEVLNKLMPQSSACRMVKVEVNQGYGFGILSGLKSCESDVIGWTHADLQTDPMDLLDAIRIYEKQGEQSFVKGERYGRPIADTFFTVGMSFFETMLMRTGLWDINAQPTLFPKSFFQTWDNPPFDFSLDLYAYYMAKKAGLRIFRFPVLFGERAHGVSNWNVDWESKKKFIKRTIDYSFELKKKVK